MGRPPRRMYVRCKMCLAAAVCDMRHITEGCQPAAVIARSHGQDIRDVFEIPTTPDRFRTMLNITCSMLTLWDTNDT